METLETPSTGRIRPARPLTKTPATAQPWLAELVATLALGWPLVLMQLAQIGVNTTEVLLVSRLGVEQLNGAALSTSAFHCLFLFGLGMAVAVAPLVAQARGAGEFRTIRRAVRQGLWATALVAIPGMLVLWNIKPILLLTGQAPGVAEHAQDFGRPLAFAIPPWLWFFVIRNFMAAMGRPRDALFVMLLAVLVNGGLGYVLIFGPFGLPALGVTGAGVASATAAWLLPIGLLLLVRRDPRLRRFHILGRLWRPDWHLLREVFRIGLPIGVALLFETSMFMVCLYLQGEISLTAQAAHVVSMQIAATAFMIPLGLSQASTVRVGLAAGRRDPAAARISSEVGFLLGFLCTLATAVLFIVAPHPLLALFLDSSRPDAEAVIATGVGFLAIAGIFQLVDGGQVMAMGCLRGLKDTRVPMIIAIFGYWAVGLPIAVLLGFATDLGGIGIWIGMASGLAAAAVLLTLRLWRQLADARQAWGATLAA